MSQHFFEVFKSGKRWQVRHIWPGFKVTVYTTTFATDSEAREFAAAAKRIQDAIEREGVPSD